MRLSSADIAFSQAVRASADHTCLRCGIQKPPTNRRGSSGMDCSHVYSRRHRTIRWCGGGTVSNAKCLCTACHRWWHENPTDSGKWYEAIVGEGNMVLLREKRDARIKISKDEEKQIALHYRLQLKIIEEKRLSGETGVIPFESYQ